MIINCKICGVEVETITHNRLYCDKCKPLASSRNKHNYYKKNREKIIAIAKEYYADNREKALARQKSYYADNREDILKYRKVLES